MGRPAFTLTARQIAALVAATPPGHVPQLTISFPKAEDAPKDKTVNPADLVDP